MFTAIDYIFGAIILIFAICCLVKGFVNELFGKAAVILGILGSVLFYSDAAKFFEGKVESQTIRNILGFILLFIAIFLILKIIGLIISKIFEISILKSLDRILGLFFGIVEGGAIVGFLIFLLTIQPFFDPTKLLTDSMFYSFFEKLIHSPEVKDIVAYVWKFS